LEQRRSWVEAYWERSDPAFSDGEGAESFNDLVNRAWAFLERLAEQPANDIVAFTHGQFMNTVRWLLEREPQEIDGRAMHDWRDYEIANHIENGQGFFIVWESGKWGVGQRRGSS
ncbi:histidine phosphatase family protein, partial [Pseudomonas aeruginosa]